MSKYITISGFEGFSAQHAFDIAAQHLLSQKKKAMRMITTNPDNPFPACAYNGSNGLTCGAGIFIRPEERAAADGAVSASWGRLASNGSVPKTNLDLIQRIQNIHDAAQSFWNESQTAEYWSKQLRQLATDRGLNQDAIDEMLTGA